MRRRPAVSLVMLTMWVAIACAKQRSPVQFGNDGVVRDENTARTVAAPPVTVEDLTGCYAMQYNNWSPALHPGNAKYQLPPDTIRLDKIRGTTGAERGRFIVRPLLPVGIEPSAFWAQYEKTVFITYSTGMAGSRSQLRVSGGILRGDIETWTDVVGLPQPRGTATAVRVSCPERLRSVR